MNRPDHYMKQLAGQAAWFRAQGDEEAAAIAEELAERIHDRHEGVDDQTTPEWAQGDDVELDVEPDIRCSPAVGIVFENSAGELILTVDMLDGGDVAVVHMGDVVRWAQGRGAPSPTAVAGEVDDAIDASFEEVAAEETAAAADEISDRDIEIELDAAEETIEDEGL